MRSASDGCSLSTGATRICRTASASSSPSRGSGREAAIRRNRTCQKFSSPHRKGPDHLFVLGRAVRATGEKLRTGVRAAHPHAWEGLLRTRARAFGVVPAISQKGENQHFSATITPENTAWEPLQPRICQGQNSKRKFLSAGRGSVAPDRSFPPATPWLAIGTAKELVETVCKTILTDLGKPLDSGWGLMDLCKEARKEIKLTPDDIPNSNRAADTRVPPRLLRKYPLGSSGVSGVAIWPSPQLVSQQALGPGGRRRRLPATTVCPTRSQVYSGPSNPPKHRKSHPLSPG